MSKRYSGKSLKDSSTMKKAKLSIREKRKIKREKKKNKVWQKNYYAIGFRNIWHSQPECIEFSDSQIYVPKETSCNFNNIEFKTIISFDEYGRISDHPINYE